MSEPLLSELIAELKAADLLLNNLFQLDSGLWRASVRSLKKDMGFNFYDHPNPGAAVRGAIAQATYKPGSMLIRNKPKALDEPAIKSGEDLLKSLGL